MESKDFKTEMDEPFLITKRELIDITTTLIGCRIDDIDYGKTMELRKEVYQDLTENWSMFFKTTQTDC